MKAGSTSSSGVQEDDARRETLLAVRNTTKLVGSLFGVWGVGLAMRLWVPRYLGPDQFGVLNFADAFAATFFIALNLGIDVYIRTEVAVRPQRASDFFAGVFVLRVFLTSVVLAVMSLVLIVMHRPPTVRWLAVLFGVAQFFVTNNSSLSALLQAKGTVGGMSILSVVSKVGWAGGLVAAIATRAGLWAFALALLVSEALESAVLYVLAHCHLGLRFRVGIAATLSTLAFGFPFCVKFVAQTAYQKLDVTLLALFARDQEIGWYGAASTLAGIAMMVSPLIIWVLTPMAARALARSETELYAMSGRSLENILAVAMPVALGLGLGADVWIPFLFGHAFAPATNSLRFLALGCLFTYFNIVCSLILTLLNRGWALTAVALFGLAVDVALNFLFIPGGLRLLGDGGGGAGSAAASVVAEAADGVVLVFLVGARAFDRRAVIAVAKTVGIAALVVALDRSIVFLGPARLIIDVATYVALVLLTGAVALGQTADLVRAAFARRASP
jgi:O-antigen/teichoic acid export membrane protein